jgi:hypothetical protein
MANLRACEGVPLRSAPSTFPPSFVACSLPPSLTPSHLLHIPAFFTFPPHSSHRPYISLFWSPPARHPRLPRVCVIAAPDVRIISWVCRGGCHPPRQQCASSVWLKVQRTHLSHRLAPPPLMSTLLVQPSCPFVRHAPHIIPLPTSPSSRSLTIPPCGSTRPTYLLVLVLHPQCSNTSRIQHIRYDAVVASTVLQSVR